MQRFFLAATFLLFILVLNAQPVQFRLAEDLLPAVSGFAGYADCVADMNGDFLDDVVRIGGKGIFIDLQQPDGTFLRKQINLLVQTPPSWSICAGDVNNDDRNDLLLAGSHSVSFIVSQDDDGYEEKLMPGFIESQRSTIFDINQDGWLDGFVCHESDHSVPFRNLGNGNLIPDSTLIRTTDKPGNYSAIWTDYNQDGYPDLYISKCLAGAVPGDPIRTNLLYKNNHDGSFTEVAAEAGLDDNAQSWSTVFEDFDHDGDMDAFIVNHDFANRLFRNNGNGTFTDVINSSGINPNDLGAFENSAGDFNNDGHMDIFSGLQKRLYLGHGDLTFTGQDAPVLPGSIGDLNEDGALDIYHDGKVWLNEANNNHWLKVNLHGIVSNRNGIGSRIELYTSSGIQVREVRSGQSFSPMSSLCTHFGLGTLDHVDSLLVKWPSGIITHIDSLKSDTTYLVPEADCLLPNFSIGSKDVVKFCTGDSLHFEAPSGFTSYHWSNGDSTQHAIVINSKSIYALATDSAGCVGFSDKILLEPNIPIRPKIFSTSGTQFCQGDSLHLFTNLNENVLWSTGEFSSELVVTESKVLTASTFDICSGDVILSEPFSVLVLPGIEPVVHDVILHAGDSVQLVASGPNLHWYDMAEGGSLLHTGPVFQTSIITSDTTFFVASQFEYGGEKMSGGKPDTTGEGGTPQQSGYLIFEANQPFTIDSVSVYVPIGGAQGVRFIQLRSQDSILASASFTVHTGLNILPLGFHVDIGEYILDCQQGNLFRNSGDVHYPFLLGNAGQITGSSHGPDFYYYFYDWKITTDSFICASRRVPLHVLITAVDLPDENIIHLFPNPATDEVWVTIPQEQQENFITLYDLSGKQHTVEFIRQKNLYKLSTESISPGIYCVVWISSGRVWKGRFVKQ